MEPKGRVVSHYEILEELGAGGMGVVYKARDLQLDRFVAVKFLPLHVAARGVQKERFIQEAKATSSLDHPNICTVHEIGEAPDGQIFIAMAYYEGETLRHKLHRGLKLAETVDIATQVAQGLAKAHSKGIIHRDIKPENIMVTNDGIVKILDFGVAKLSGAATLTQSGALLGTVSYMSPEQIDGEIDHRTDLWSLGVVFYEMVTGRHPFHTDRERATIYHILHQNPASPTGLRPDIPVALERVIARLLEKDPSQRYARAEDVVEGLRLVRPRGSQDLFPSTEVFAPKKTSQAPPSIVVLPFANLSPEPEAEYFSDGLAEELIYALSRVEGIHVVSRVSAFEFKGKAQNLTQIGQQLKVNSVLTGSVRMAAGRLRVNVEMTNVTDGYCLWSDRFDREARDVFAIQDEIATSVVNILRHKLVDQRTAALAPHYAGHPEAYNLYLKGRYHYKKTTQQGFQKAGECFRQAIALDPNCAPAYSGLADFYLIMGFWSVVPPKEAWPKAREYALKAIQIDPGRPEPHIALAKILQFGDWDRRAARIEFRRAIDLNPGLSEAHFAYSIFLLQTGLLGQAQDEIKRAHELDPLNLSVATGVAWLCYYLGDYQRASDECRQVLEMSPDYAEAQGCMALCSEKLGRPAEHVAWLEKAAAGGGGLPFVLGLLGRAYALNGQTDKAVEFQAKLQELSEKHYTSQVARALVSLGLGELDRAMHWLEEALQAHDAFLCYAKVFPPYDPLRSNPRFQEMLRHMGVADPVSSETAAAP